MEVASPHTLFVSTAFTAYAAYTVAYMPTYIANGYMASWALEQKLVWLWMDGWDGTWSQPLHCYDY